MSRIVKVLLFAAVVSLAVASTPTLSNAGVKNFAAVISGACKDRRGNAVDATATPYWCRDQHVRRPDHRRGLR